MSKALKLMSAALTLVFLGIPALNAQNGFDLNGKTAAGIGTAGTQKGFPQIFSHKPEANGTKDWTVMVFMNAKNDLAESHLLGMVGKWAEKDLGEMQKVGTTAKVNVVVDIGIKGKGAKRLLVGKKGLIGASDKVISTDPKADMGDYRRAIDFIKTAKAKYPAKKYMFILWNHGLGWIDPVMEAAPSGTGTGAKGISFDDETRNYIRTVQLGEIFRQAGYVDVFMQNACLQQMVEVAYEVKDGAGLIVGSEETMLAQGFDYVKLLNFMNGNTAFSNEQLSDFLMNWYRAFYAEGIPVGPIHVPATGMGATLSTLRPAALNQLPGYLDAFAGAVMRNNETAAVKAAIANVIRFTSLDPKNDKKKQLSFYSDLYDYARIVGGNAGSPDTKQAAQDLMGFIKNGLVMRSVGIGGDTENGYDYTKVGGLAINTTLKLKKIPDQLAGIFETRYADLSLSKDSQWDEFITWTDSVWQAE